MSGGTRDTDASSGADWLAASALTLNVLLRQRWGIENGLHYRRDKTLGEDQQRQKRGRGGQTLAILNNMVVRLVGKRSLAAAQREYIAYPHKALQLLSSAPQP